MRRNFNRLTSLLIAVTIIFSLLPMSFLSAETTFPDFPTGWSKPAMEAAVANGLISGYEDGTVRPKGNLTRAEVSQFMYNILGIRSYFVVCFIRKSGGVALCLEHISQTEEKEKRTMASETE